MIITLLLFQGRYFIW